MVSTAGRLDFQKSVSKMEPTQSLYLCPCGSSVHVLVTSVQRLANVHWPSHVSTRLLTAYSVMDASWCPLLCESQIFTHYARSLKDIHIPQGQTSLSSIFQSFSFQTPDQPIRIFPLLMSVSSFSPQTPAPSTQKE